MIVLKSYSNDNLLSNTEFEVDVDLVSIIELENGAIKFIVPNGLTTGLIMKYDALGRQLHHMKKINGSVGFSPCQA